MRILILEDEWLIAEDHADRVRKAGHEVVGPAPSVAAALRWLEGGTVEGALLDVQLNGETSYACADALAERNIPFAFMTGYGGEKLPARFNDVPVLQKPAQEPDFVRAIDRLTMA